jgi:hypothetical protein
MNPYFSFSFYDCIVLCHVVMHCIALRERLAKCIAERITSQFAMMEQGVCLDLCD